MDLSKEEIIILHGAVQNEIGRVKIMQRDTSYGGQITLMYSYEHKLCMVLAKLEAKIKENNEQG
jgi:hypothetical protein